MDVKTQKKALPASWEAASSVLTNEWYDEWKSNVIETATV